MHKYFDIQRICHIKSPVPAKSMNLFISFFFFPLSLCVSHSRYASDAEFVRVAMMKESDNEEDDKVYLFFTERAQEAEGPAGKVLYTRVARVCKVCVCTSVRLHAYLHVQRWTCSSGFLPA